MCPTVEEGQELQQRELKRPNLHCVAGLEENVHILTWKCGGQFKQQIQNLGLNLLTGHFFVHQNTLFVLQVSD